MKLKELNFVDYPRNPIIKAPFPEWILADPSVLTPDESPDNMWHLFSHSVLDIRHYISSDGVKWRRKIGPISYFSYRPFVYKEDGTYYLIYEKIGVPHKIPFFVQFPFYSSRLELRTSKDLFKWSKPKTIATPTLPWHKSTPSKGNLGNPCLIKVGNTYRLYYSSGLVYLPDCRFCEPRYVGVAKSDNIAGPYSFNPNPLFTREDDKYTNISTSAARVYQTGNGFRVFPYNDGFLGLQTCIYNDPQTNKSSAIIRATYSKDGLRWQVVTDPILRPDKDWKKSHVYVGDLKRYNGELRIYYNARNGWLFGSESIGMAIAK